MIDVSTQINAVERALATRTISEGEATVLTMSQTFPTDAADLWDAVTTATRIPQWFLPITGDLRAGGTYQTEGNAGGTIESCDAPTHFRATWEFGGEVSWIEVTITPVDETHATFTLEHIAIPKEEFATEFGPGAVGIGWDMGLIGLALHTASGKAVDPAAYQTWAMTEDGLDFVRQSSARWRDASIANGTDPDAAQAAADRVTAFYTGAEA